MRQDELAFSIVEMREIFAKLGMKDAEGQHITNANGTSYNGLTTASTADLKVATMAATRFP